MTTKYDDIQAGDKIPTLTKGPLEQLQVVRYAGASGDFNPIHTIPEVAQAAGLEGTISHGMLVMAFAGQLITDWLGVGSVRNLNVRFKGMTLPGDTLTCTGSVTEKLEENGEKLVKGKISVKGQDERPRLTGTFVAMVAD